MVGIVVSVSVAVVVLVSVVVVVSVAVVVRGGILNPSTGNRAGSASSRERKIDPL